MCTKIDTDTVVPLRWLHSLEITLCRWWQMDELQGMARKRFLVMNYVLYVLGPLLLWSWVCTRSVCVCFFICCHCFGCNRERNSFGIIVRSHHAGMCVFASHCIQTPKNVTLTDPIMSDWWMNQSYCELKDKDALNIWSCPVRPNTGKSISAQNKNWLLQRMPLSLIHLYQKF